MIGVLALTCVLATSPVNAGTNAPAISVTPDGAVTIDGVAVVPRYPGNGGWTEAKGRSSSNYVTRHFNFTSPAGPPAIELYVAHDLTKAVPDGAFEIGMVGGYLSAFSSGMGMQQTATWDDVVIGGVRLKRCRAELSKGERRLWFYAYVFVRQPSLTFVAIRPRGDAGPGIEDYLKTVRLK